MRVLMELPGQHLLFTTLYHDEQRAPRPDDGCRGSYWRQTRHVVCPVCNKLVLLALGYTGALQFFEHLQPYLAAGSLLLLTIALIQRIRKERACPLLISQ